MTRVTELSMLAEQLDGCVEGFYKYALVEEDHYLHRWQRDYIERLHVAVARIKGRAEQLEAENKYLRSLLQLQLDEIATDNVVGCANES